MTSRASRAERHPIAEWWRTADHLLFTLALVLMASGVVLSLAASPPVAERIGAGSFHFVQRHLVYLGPALAVMFTTSLLEERLVRRVALLVLLGSLALMVAVLFVGEEVKGARRWIDIGPLGLQPSEFVKPAFVVVAAWLFAEGERRRDVPGFSLACGLAAFIVLLLILQPDFGQTLLVVLIWGGIYFVVGMPWLLIVGLGGLALAGALAAYFTVPHVAQRIDRFLDPSSGDTYQIDMALGSFRAGGWFGVGPGEGVMKRGLPDAHTDFIFAVVAEEYGALVCLALVALFGLVVLRGLAHAFRSEDIFKRLAIGGLVLLFGLQSAINFAVNLHLMPAKGMTLPFISYGGSSLIASAFAMGLLIALTKRRPRPAPLVEAPPPLLAAQAA